MDRLGDSGEFDLVQELGPLVMHIAAHAFLGPDISERITGFFAEFRRFSAGMDPVLPGWLPLPHLLRSLRSRDRLRIRLQRTHRRAPPPACRPAGLPADHLRRHLRRRRTRFPTWCAST